MSASLVEAEARAGNQILDGSRHQHLARSGERRDARGDVDCNALHVVAGDLDLAGMEAAADLNVQRPEGFGYGAGATNGTCRTVKGGEKPISKRFHLGAAGPCEFTSHRLVMCIE